MTNTIFIFSLLVIASQAVSLSEIKNDDQGLLSAAQAEVFLMKNGQFQSLGLEGDLEVQKIIRKDINQAIVKIEQEEQKELEVAQKPEEPAKVVEGIPNVSSDLTHPWPAETKKNPTIYFDKSTPPLDHMKTTGCVYVFSECNFKGKSLASCPHKSVALTNFPYPVASVFIPDNAQVTVSESVENTAVAFLESNSCLEHPIHFAIMKASIETVFANGEKFFY